MEPCQIERRPSFDSNFSGDLQAKTGRRLRMPGTGAFGRSAGTARKAAGASASKMANVLKRKLPRTNGYKSACPSPDDSENILPPAEGSDGELREAVVDHVSCWDDSPAELSNLLTVDELKNDDSQRKCAAPLATQVTEAPVQSTPSNASTPSESTRSPACSEPESVEKSVPLSDKCSAPPELPSVDREHRPPSGSRPATVLARSENDLSSDEFSVSPQQRHIVDWNPKAFGNFRPLECGSIWEIPTSRIPNPRPASPVRVNVIGVPNPDAPAVVIPPVRVHWGKVARSADTELPTVESPRLPSWNPGFHWRSVAALVVFLALLAVMAVLGLPSN